MHNFGAQVPVEWLKRHLTILADDIHLCQLITCEEDLNQAIQRFGLFFQCAHALGLKINFKKTEDALDELGRQLRPDPVQPSEPPVLPPPSAAASVASGSDMPVEHAFPVAHRPSELFDIARATPVGRRAWNLIVSQNWQGIKADEEVRMWLCAHCVVCNIYVGNLKRMIMHMRQHHQEQIDGLYQTARTVLKRCGTASPCECNKVFQCEHLCPTLIQASMALIHELPIAAGPSQADANSQLSSKRTRRLVVHDFVLARDSMQGSPQCSHCHRKFDTVNGLKMHIVLGKCSRFDINRSQTPVEPDVDQTGSADGVIVTDTWWRQLRIALHPDCSTEIHSQHCTGPDLSVPLPYIHLSSLNCGVGSQQLSGLVTAAFEQHSSIDGELKVDYSIDFLQSPNQHRFPDAFVQREQDSSDRFKSHYARLALSSPHGGVGSQQLTGLGTADPKFGFDITVTCAGALRVGSSFDILAGPVWYTTSSDIALQGVDSPADCSKFLALDFVQQIHSLTTYLQQIAHSELASFSEIHLELSALLQQAWLSLMTPLEGVGSLFLPGLVFSDFFRSKLTLALQDQYWCGLSVFSGCWPLWPFTASGATFTDDLTTVLDQRIALLPLLGLLIATILLMIEVDCNKSPLAFSTFWFGGGSLFFASLALDLTFRLCCSCLFHQLDRHQKDVARQHKVIQQLTHQAGLAAQRNDLFRLYHLVNGFTPKQKKSRIQLRTTSGLIASPIEELAIFSAYVKRIWFDVDALPALRFCQPHPPGVLLTQQDLPTALRRAPIVKAVAAPYPPNLMWRCTAIAISDIAYQDLQCWQNQWPPHIPEVWQRGWLVFISKPDKPPNAPQNLRALAMQEPVGKAILKILTSQLQEATFGTLSKFSQMAYTRARGTQDASIRVVHQVKALMRTNTASLRNHLSGSSKLSCFGGIQMFIDLEKAFGMAPRAEVIRFLVQLAVPQALISLFAAWHTCTSYVINHHDMEDLQPTNRGVRQGCITAPQLRSCLMYLLMQRYSERVPMEWMLKQPTIFADDVHLCQVIQTETGLQTAIDRFGHFITCAHDLGLKITFQKTEILLRLAGHFHSHVQRTEQGFFLRVPYGRNQVAHVPLKASATYLGACITYQNLQKATVAHRIAASCHIFQRLKIWLSCSSRIPVDKRLQLWQTTVFAAMTYGIFTVGLPPQGFQTIQSEIMRQLRLVAGNFSLITEMSHFEFLHARSWHAPARLLLNRVEGMISRYSKRFCNLAWDDILLQHDWSHLQETAQMLRQAMAPWLHVEPIAKALHSALNPVEFHACFFCTCAFSTVRARKMHMWLEHGYSLKHFRPVTIAQGSSNGMPYCQHCDLEFTTWKLFQKHMALHVGQVVTQATSAELANQLAATMSSASVPAATDPDVDMHQPMNVSPAGPSAPTLFQQHMALHVAQVMPQATSAELANQLAATPTSASVPAVAA
eukprot:s240_g25.t1